MKQIYLFTMMALGITTSLKAQNTLSDEKQDTIKQVRLEEVTVTADKSQVVTQKADRTIFYPSKHARELSNPYEALREIPKLVVDENNRTITLANGQAPLILINGNRVNKGLNSIDPKDVESIEVIEFPSARYLKEGVTAVVNIKMKRKSALYQSFNLYTRHMIPALFGIGGAYYEVGNAKASLSVSGQDFYFCHDKSDLFNRQQNTGYTKEWNATQKYQANSFYVDMKGDWICSDNDYLAMSITYLTNPSKNSSTGEGMLEQDEDVQRFNQETHYKNTYYINTYNLYHKHTFSKDRLLETTLRFNTNGNSQKGSQTETYPQQTYLNKYEYDNHRYSGELDVNYSFVWKKQTFDINNNVHFLNDRIEQRESGFPLFRHKEWNEYINVNASGNLLPQLFYTLSAGMDMIFKQSGDIDHNYYRPVVNASLTGKINSTHALTGSYALTNQTPQVGELNPYNTSTDSLKRVCGNPYLLPARTQTWNLRYTYNRSGFYLEPAVEYKSIRKMSVVTGSTDEETHIYTQTYQNTGRFGQLSSRINAAYNHSKWGGVSVMIANFIQYYEHQRAKSAFSYSLNFYGWYKQLSWNGYLSFMPRNYGVNSRSKSYGSESEVTLSYKLNSHFSLTAGMRYLMGALKSKNYMQQDTYSSYTYQRMNDRSYRVQVGFSYYMQGKNYKYRNKKQLNSKEDGISL